jgi:hypothetical protein
MPLDFTLVTAGREYRVNRLLISSLSDAVFTQLQQDPNTVSFDIGLDVPDLWMSKFVSALSGAAESFPGPGYSYIVTLFRALQIRQRISGSPTGDRPTDFLLQLCPSMLAAFLDQMPMLTIVTNAAHYDVPVLSAAFSPVLRRHMDTMRYVYDFADEEVCFHSVAEYLTTGFVGFTRANCDSLLAISSDLELKELRADVEKYRENLNATEAILETHSEEIDRSIWLQETLLGITTDNVGVVAASL